MNLDSAGDNLSQYYRVLIKEGVHDFNVWNNGAFVSVAYPLEMQNI